ncbi:MAG: hypothetical protein RI907_3451 [Pseudomonadota bacterium]|jgi:hypothetical protein
MRKPPLSAMLTLWPLLAVLAWLVSARHASAATTFEPEAQAPCVRDAQAVGMPSGDRIFHWIEDIVAFGPRRSGTEANARAAAWVKCQFEALGLQGVHFHTAPTWFWEASRHSLQVNGFQIDSFPVAFSAVEPGVPNHYATGPNGLQAEIVDVGDGRAVDLVGRSVKGKIALFNLRFEVSTAAFLPLMEFLWDPTLSAFNPQLFVANPYQTNLVSAVKRLMDAGAVGVVGVLADYHESNRYYNEFYRRLEVTVPGVWVSPGEGARIRTLLKNGRNTQARLDFEARREQVPGRAVVGVLPGRTSDAVLVTSHHDSVWAGAVEDGSGTASVLAQAQYFASRPDGQLDKTLVFVTMDSHFSGYQVHRSFGEKWMGLQAPYKVVADVTIEHIAKEAVNRGGRLVLSGQSEVFGIFESFRAPLTRALKDAVKRHDLRRTAVLGAHTLCGTVGIPTDAFACTGGIPTASFISGPAYLYDEQDTLDKVDRTKLLPVARVFADFIEAIDRTPSDKIGR